jgi:hypothetical protein
MSQTRSQVVGQMDRVEVLERSLRCFALGLLGLIPGAGFPMAVVAIVDFCRVTARQGYAWNPAQRYLNWGLAAAVFGILFWVLAALVLIQIIALQSLENG